MRRSNARTVNPNSPEMDPSKLQFRSTRPGFRSPKSKHPNPKTRLCFYVSISISLALFCYIIFSHHHKPVSKNPFRYGLVIDGGSTGTRIHVFKYSLLKDGSFNFDFSEKGLVSMRVNPGLSSYVDDPEKAGGAVNELVEFGKRNVPREMWGVTDVRLMATAGMRLLSNVDQDRILSVCRKVLRGSGFRFRDDWATVISGSDEGLYAWVVANYALGTLGGEPGQTTGIIELGGASAQVTFVSNEPMPPQFSRKVEFGNFSYNLYSHSLLQFGQNVAFELLKESLASGGQVSASVSLQRGKPVDPCTPRGYTHEKNNHLSTLLPNGNFTECRSASLKLLHKGQDKCSYPTCNIGSIFIPKLEGRFLATENFFHTSKFFGLNQRTFLSDIVVAGQEFCGEDWSKLTKKYSSLAEEELLPYCFSSAYIVAMLHDSLGIALDDQRIGYANQVQNIPLDWALGAFILQSSAELGIKHSSLFATITGNGSSSLPLLLGLILVTVLVSWFVSKWRKPQVKTIYDLEKGKYIITRVGRYS